MSIYERKKKDGSISFDITVYDGYQIDEAGNYVQLMKQETMFKKENTKHFLLQKI